MRWLVPFARFGVLGLGVIFAYLACLAWTTGEPPPASLFGPRATAEVVEAHIVSWRQNGSLRPPTLVNLLRPLSPEVVRVRR